MTATETSAPAGEEGFRCARGWLFYLSVSLSCGLLVFFAWLAWLALTAG